MSWRNYGHWNLKLKLTNLGPVPSLMVDGQLESIWSQFLYAIQFPPRGRGLEKKGHSAQSDFSEGHTLSATALYRGASLYLGREITPWFRNLKISLYAAVWIRTFKQTREHRHHNSQVQFAVWILDTLQAKNRIAVIYLARTIKWASPWACQLLGASRNITPGI